MEVFHLLERLILWPGKPAIQQITCRSVTLFSSDTRAVWSGGSARRFLTSVRICGGFDFSSEGGLSCNCSRGYGSEPPEMRRASYSPAPPSFDIQRVRFGTTCWREYRSQE